MITPSGVVMASATALTMECVTWMNSILNGPISTICLGLTLMKRGSSSSSYSSRRRSTRASVKVGAVDRHVDFGEEVGHGADVVFMAVGQDQGADLRLVLLEEGEVGHHQVDAQQLGFGEHHSAIDDDDVVAVADGGHVHAELAQSAEGNYL